MATGPAFGTHKSCWTYCFLGDWRSCSATVFSHHPDFERSRPNEHWSRHRLVSTAKCGRFVYHRLRSTYARPWIALPAPRRWHRSRCFNGGRARQRTAASSADCSGPRKELIAGNVRRVGFQEPASHIRTLSSSTPIASAAAFADRPRLSRSARIRSPIVCGAGQGSRPRKSIIAG
jgi:hypothetical protein